MVVYLAAALNYYKMMTNKKGNFDKHTREWYTLSKIKRCNIPAFKTKLFHQWARKAGLTDNILKDAINEIENGLYGDKLGGNLYKKRIGVNGQGKRGSLRTILALKNDEKIFFIYGYAKNERANIDNKEKYALRKLAKDYFSLNSSEIEHMLELGNFVEVK